MVELAGALIIGLLTWQGIKILLARGIILGSRRKEPEPAKRRPIYQRWTRTEQRSENQSRPEQEREAKIWRLDDGDLGVIGNDETRHSSDGCKGARVGTDPIAKRLRPGRLDVGEARGPHPRDEDLCLAHLAAPPVDGHRYRVAGVMDEELVATDVA